MSDQDTVSGADEREWAAVFGPLSTDEERDRAERNSIARLGTFTVEWAAENLAPHTLAQLAADGIATSAAWREELERFGVRFVDDDPVVGIYWLPAPKGQPVAGSLREALEARAAELRAEGAVAMREQVAELCDESAGVDAEFLAEAARTGDGSGARFWRACVATAERLATKVRALAVDACEVPS